MEPSAALQPEDLTLSAHAHGDGIGTLFSANGRLYRAIRAEHAGFYQGLFESGLVDRLIERGQLVGSRIIDMTIPGFELVIEHDRLPFVAYPTEWCGLMLRDAAVATLELQATLLENGVTLVDAHGWNIIFDGTRPVMVDLTAIHQLSEDGYWSAELDFRSEMLYPAVMASRGRFELGQLLAESSGVKDSDLIPLLRMNLDWGIRRLWRRACLRLGMKHRTTHAELRSVDRMRQRLAGLTFEASRPTENAGGTDQAFRICFDTIRQLGVTSVITVNADSVSCPLAFARAGFKVVAAHRDEPHCADVYRAAAPERLDVLALVIDLAASNSSFGSFDRSPGPVARRLGCDLVVADVARPDGGVISQAQFDQYLQGLSTFAGRGLLVRITVPADSKSSGDLSDLELEGLLQRHASSLQRLAGEGPAYWYLLHK